MTQSISCITPRGNIYTINKDKKLLYLTHPKLAKVLYKNAAIENEDDDYYVRKVKYLKMYGLLDKFENQYDGLITPSMIKNSIANLNQLVFEVTDACNLQCRYCGYRELYDDYDLRTTRMMNYDPSQFVDYKADVEKPLPMIYQSGYLTVKDCDLEMGTFLLDFPNNEVKKGFVTLVANNYLQSDKG